MPSPRRAFAYRIFALLLLTSVSGAGTCKAIPGGKADLIPARARISQSAWLDERLPEHTVAYARIPSFWGLLSAPDERSLDPALASPEHIKIITSLRDAVRRSQLIIDTGAAPVINLLLGDLGAPMELAVIDVSDQLTPASNLFLTTQVNVPDIATLNTRMSALSASSPLLKAPFDAKGSAELQKNGFLQFDLATHRLYAVVGVGASRASLDEILGKLAITHMHPMLAAEREIDTSGEGLFVWINLKGLTGAIVAKMPQIKSGTALHDLADHSQSLAFGWGTVAGRGRMRLLLDAPDARMLGYLAHNTFAAHFNVAGKPRWVATLALPSASQLQAIENNLDQDYGVGTQQKYRGMIARMQANIGAVPMDFARTIGPELIMFSDANGSFYALRMRDRAGFYSLLGRLGKRFGWRSAITRAGKTEIHQLHLPGITPPPAKPGTNPRTNAWFRLYSRIGTHFYWVEDGDYLVFASVPQLLIDRINSKLDTRLGDWLSWNHSGHNDATLVGFSGTSKNAQRDLYYAYLNVLQSIGDMLDQPVDLMPLPAANKLQLPVDGMYGISIEASKSRIGFSLGYEQSPVELVTHGTGVTSGVAVVAILAAIAIPAYQDYVVRAQVSEGASLAEGAKTAVSEYRLHHKGMPADNAAAGLAPATRITGNFVSEVRVDRGFISVTYSSHAPQKANAALDGGVLAFTPKVENGVVHWTCASANIAPKYLPSPCR
jgi:Tfp pilus assembly major pilin PilA